MTKVQDQILKRFAELQRQGQGIALRHEVNSSEQRADSQQFYAWASSCHHAIQSVFGEDSPHCINFQNQLSKISSNFVWESNLASIKGVFLGAKSDVDGGYLFHLQASLTGEIFGDLVTGAKAALNEGNHTVATVLACAALEDALKRYASSKDLTVDDKTMEDVINALKSKGHVSGAQKGLLGAMPKIRNYAMHAQWDKLTPQDAGSVIGFVEQFLLTNFT